MKSFIKILVLAIVLNSCGGSDSSPEPPTPEAKELGAFNLVFPDNNLICTEGQDTGTNEVSINFLWGASANATSYALEITNLETGVKTNETATTIEKAVVLPKDAQFTWNVTAVLGDLTKKSTEWNFYSEGIATENFAPFPAEISVSDNTNGTVDISWIGSDLDNDIENYDVKITEDSQVLETFEQLQMSELAGITISYGTTYDIEVITRDANGNISQSSTQFNF